MENDVGGASPCPSCASPLPTLGGIGNGKVHVDDAFVDSTLEKNASASDSYDVEVESSHDSREERAVGRVKDSDASS